MTGFRNFSVILYVIFPPHFGSSSRSKNYEFPFRSFLS
jgi:hypothetical protein